MNNDGMKEFLRQNLEIVVEYEHKYSPGNSQIVGLRFKGEDKCFTEETVYVPGEDD
jgi:hypothetical protein